MISKKAAPVRAWANTAYTGQVEFCAISSIFPASSLYCSQAESSPALVRR